MCLVIKPEYLSYEDFSVPHVQDPVMSVCLCSDIIFECNEFMTQL